MSVIPELVPSGARSPRYALKCAGDGNERAGLPLAKSNEIFSEK
jgi:hypothetical protein